MQEDEKIQLKKFFEKIFFDLHFSNKNAHSIDLSQSIVDQIFTYIDPENKLANVKKKLLKGKMNNLLKQSGLNRLNISIIKLKLEKKMKI